MAHDSGINSCRARDTSLGSWLCWLRRISSVFMGNDPFSRGRWRSDKLKEGLEPFLDEPLQDLGRNWLVGGDLNGIHPLRDTAKHAQVRALHTPPRPSLLP